MDTSYFSFSSYFPSGSSNKNTNNYYKNFKDHIVSIKILHNNKKLLEHYQFAPYFLYSLHKQEHPNMKMQQDYNKLHYHYKYHHIQTHGVPYGIILAHFDEKSYARTFNNSVFKINNLEEGL